MITIEIKEFISKLLNQGISLSEIQKRLQSEKNEKITFLDLRVLASELKDIDWAKQKADIAAEKAKEKAKKEQEKKELAGEELEGDGNIVVEMSKVTRPGALANGSVKFASGATAEWMIDQMGRLALDKTAGEPTKEDIHEFQAELQKIISQGM